MLRIVDQNRSAAAFVLLIALCGVLTLTMQSSIGGLSIYSESVETRRLQAHDTILNNKLPDGVESWNSLGANGTNIRIASVYLAEAMHRVFGISVIHSYWFIDTISLFLALFLLYFFLSNWLPRHYAVLGVIYVGSVLPLTYLFALFHPWDRLSLLSWVVLFMLVQSRRPFILGVALALSVSIKYDAVLLPGLYWLAHVSHARFTRTSLETAALFAVSFGVYFGLRAVLPGGFGGGPSVSALVAENMQRLIELAAFFPPIAYPPFLVFLLPVLLIIFRFPKDDQFLRAAIVFSGVLMFYFFIRSHFEEVRAHMPLLLLILPAALLSLQRLLEPAEIKSDG